jgi:hypothetical protein
MVFGNFVFGIYLESFSQLIDTPDTDKYFEMGIMFHDGDKKKDFFKSIKSLYKVQEDLHEVVSNATENSLQALFWV